MTTQMVQIFSYPDEEIFLAFQHLDSFSVSYDISWDSVPIYGRQDSIQSYKSTGQTVTFAVMVNSPQPGGKETPGSAPWIIKNLNKMLRPSYSNNIINQSPLLRVDIGTIDNPYYSTPGFVLAPSSVSVDYGDRGRLVQQSIYGSGVDPNANLDVLPEKMLITFSGPIINLETVYRAASSASPTDPSTTTSTPTPQADANTAKTTSPATSNPILKHSQGYKP